eukprot:1160224-Pelagomonas_calceolata.AAC.8
MSDSECIGEFLVIGGLLASAGSLEHTGSLAMASDTSKLMSVSRQQAWSGKVEQPAAAGLLLLQRGGAAAEAAKGRPWRKQVPRWAAVSMLDQVSWPLPLTHSQRHHPIGKAVSARCRQSPFSARPVLFRNFKSYWVAGVSSMRCPCMVNSKQAGRGCKLVEGTVRGYLLIVLELSSTFSFLEIKRMCLRA